MKNDSSSKEFDISASSQRQRLLAWLREKPITTLEARQQLDIMAPAPRIYELRHDQDCNIILQWIVECTAKGIKHRMGQYFLKSGKWSEKGGKQ